MQGWKGSRIRSRILQFGEDLNNFEAIIAACDQSLSYKPDTS